MERLPVGLPLTPLPEGRASWQQTLAGTAPTGHPFAILSIEVGTAPAEVFWNTWFAFVEEVAPSVFRVTPVAQITHLSSATNLADLYELESQTIRTSLFRGRGRFVATASKAAERYSKKISRGRRIRGYGIEDVLDHFTGGSVLNGVS